MCSTSRSTSLSTIQSSSTTYLPQWSNKSIPTSVLTLMCLRLDFECLSTTPSHHLFVQQVFSPLTRTYKSIYDYPSIKGSRILANQSVLRVSAKSTEQFKCTVEFFDHLNTKHGYDVVVDNCCNEAVKYQKLMDKFWDHCGKNFPINYTFEVGLHTSLSGSLLRLTLILTTCSVLILFSFL